MEKAANGKFISVEYTGTLEDGQVFDTSKGKQPLEVHLGAGQMIPGFENALLGMGLNEKKTFTLTPEEAYGDWDETLTQEFDRKDIPADMDIPEVGQTIAVTVSTGSEIPAQIIKVTDEAITIDMNHPLAGESLTFDIEVVGISDTATRSFCGGGCGGGCDSSECGSSDCECC